VFAADELRALLRALALVRELEPLLRLYEGMVLHCAPLETFENDTGPGVRIGDIVLVADAQIVCAGPLSVPVTPAQRHVYLDWRVAEPPLDDGMRQVPVSCADARLSTSAKPESEHRLEIARLRWRGERPHIDSSWWPDVARIGGDARSLATAKKLLALLPQEGQMQKWFAGRLAHCEWTAFLPWVVQAVSARIAPAGGSFAPVDDSVAAFAASLLRWVSNEGGLPVVLDGCKLIAGIRPESVKVHGSQTIYRFAADCFKVVKPHDVRKDLRLAIQAQTTEKLARATLKTRTGNFERPVIDQTPAMIGNVAAGFDFALTLEKAELAYAGLYASSFTEA
jgi:hypothetical protein